MRSENALISRSVSETIKNVVRNHEGEPLTQELKSNIKREFISGMKNEGFDWSIYTKEISIEIMANGGINLQIPPALLNPTTH